MYQVSMYYTNPLQTTPLEAESKTEQQPQPQPNRNRNQTATPTAPVCRALSIGLQDFHNRLPVEDGGRGGFGACDAERRRTEMDPSIRNDVQEAISRFYTCLLYTSPSPRD